jgi:hypothetical protein
MNLDLIFFIENLVQQQKIILNFVITAYVHRGHPQQNSHSRPEASCTRCINMGYISILIDYMHLI